MAFQIKILCFKQPSVRVVSTHNLIKKLKAPFFVWVSFVGRKFQGHWFSATPPWDSRKHYYLLNVSGQKPKPLVASAYVTFPRWTPVTLFILIGLLIYLNLLQLGRAIATMGFDNNTQMKKTALSKKKRSGEGKLVFVTPWSTIFGVRESWCTEKLFRESRFKCTPWNLNWRSSEVNEALIWPNDLN